MQQNLYFIYHNLVNNNRSKQAGKNDQKNPPQTHRLTPKRKKAAAPLGFFLLLARNVSFVLL